VNGNDGRRLCWDLKHQQDNQVAVLLMSGYDYSKSRAALFGADDLLPKPLNTEYLLYQVNQYLEVG
jgi:DNA-binding response OmpR family regulator